MKKGILLIIAVVGLSLASIGQNNNFEIAKNIEIYTSLYKELNENYVDEIQPGELMQTGIEAMLESLDPYTNYIPESDVEDYRFMTTGQYGGIGSLIHKQDEYVVISEPYKGFPAEEAGLKAGDKIAAINGESAKGKSTGDVSNILKGQPGTSIQLTIIREGFEEPIVKDLERKTIRIDNVTYYGMLDHNIGYINLNGFTQNAWKEVRKAFTNLRSNNELEGLIIDLRGNGGGLLTEAVNVANLFIEKDELIVSTKGKLKDKNKTYKTRFQPLDKDLPLAIMVNGSSASASEILSGAAQDLDRGVVIGQRTFGKGLVQNVVPLSYNAKAKITVAKYYIPSGRCIQAIDYSHKDENGNADKIPDSLISEFKTRNGRLVYDGGGIKPDLVLEQQRLSNISLALYTKFLIFDYANKFARQHDSIPPARDFEITDEIYGDFKNFIADKDYDYTTQSEKTLEKLKEYSEKEKYFEAIEGEYEALEQKMMHDKDDDLIEFRDEIEELLKIEIVSRYYYQEGKVIASLEDDPEIRKAIEVLTDSEKYNELLGTKDITQKN